MAPDALSEVEELITRLESLQSDAAPVSDNALYLQQRAAAFDTVRLELRAMLEGMPQKPEVEHRLHDLIARIDALEAKRET